MVAAENERTERFNLKMSPREIAMLDALAEAEGVTASDVVRGLIRRAHRKLATPATKTAGKGRSRWDVRQQERSAGTRRGTGKRACG
jgi:uncharacterized protein (DUF1778 family)